MSRPRHIARALALAFLAGPWLREELLARAQHVLGARPAWLPAAVRLVQRLFPEAPIGRDEQLTRLLARSKTLRDALANTRGVHVQHWLYPEPRMAKPARPFAALALPALTCEGDLCTLFGVDAAQLAWLADLSRFQRSARDPRLQHYVYRWIPKRSGAQRLLEAPKPRLKRLQRTLLERIIAPIPAHPACHGFEAARSVKSFVAPHAGKHALLALDLEDFFVSIREARVRALLRRAGYPDRVASVLAGLCCTPTPHSVLSAAPLPPNPMASDLSARHALKQRLRDAHLPQGAPTSPALANRIAFKLDARLAGLARAYGATYTRYADDLAFSGDARFERALDGFIAHVGAVVLEEGFRVRHRKTRVMGRAVRQQLCGVVVNRAPSIARKEYERLEAILTNCVRRGPAGENREGHSDFRAHLVGRVAWVAHLHPEKGARLARLLEQVVWPS